MTDTKSSYDRYSADHSALEGSPLGAAPSWLRDMRKRGLASFTSAGFPTATRGNERWKYTNLGPLARTVFEYPLHAPADGPSPRSIQRSVPWHDTWQRLVFVDGRFSPSLSSSPATGNGIVLANLADAADDGVSLDGHLGRYAVTSEDGFTAVNTAFLRDGAVVHVPAGASPAAPIHMVYLSTRRDRPQVTHPRTLVLAGRDSRLTLVESYVGPSGATYFTNAVAEIVAEDGARIEHYRYLAESPDAYHIGNTYVVLGRDSDYTSNSFATGARTARNELHVLLDGPGGRCVLNGLYLVSGAEHIDNHIDIDHASPHTTSDQYFKGVLDGNSRAVFSGRVLVRRDAQKTRASQADKNLLLSQGARVNTKPSLEILADDVQCNHGATAGAVAADALFYLRSRGLDEDTATALLVHGFASEIIQRFGLRPLRARLDRALSELAPGAKARAA